MPSLSDLTVTPYEPLEAKEFDQLQSGGQRSATSASSRSPNHRTLRVAVSTVM
jgi:hypothetical protein